jgi:hypothetical protein
LGSYGHVPHVSVALVIASFLDSSFYGLGSTHFLFRLGEGLTSDRVCALNLELDLDDCLVEIL